MWNGGMRNETANRISASASGGIHSAFRTLHSAFDMIFQFPDFETLRLAITTGVVPTSVSLAGAEMAADLQGRVSVKPAGGIPPKPMQNALKKLGIKAGKEHVAEPENVSCWLQALPLFREPGVP